MKILTTSDQRIYILELKTILDLLRAAVRDQGFDTLDLFMELFGDFTYTKNGTLHTFYTLEKDASPRRICGGTMALKTALFRRLCTAYGYEDLAFFVSRSYLPLLPNPDALYQRLIRQIRLCMELPPRQRLRLLRMFDHGRSAGDLLPFLVAACLIIGNYHTAYRLSCGRRFMPGQGESYALNLNFLFPDQTPLRHEIWKAARTAYFRIYLQTATIRKTKEPKPLVYPVALRTYEPEQTIPLFLDLSHCPGAAASQRPGKETAAQALFSRIAALVRSTSLFHHNESTLFRSIMDELCKTPPFHIPLYLLLLYQPQPSDFLSGKAGMRFSKSENILSNNSPCPPLFPDAPHACSNTHFPEAENLQKFPSPPLCPDGSPACSNTYSPEAENLQATYPNILIRNIQMKDFPFDSFLLY